MQENSRQSAETTIPAVYLEEVRSALIEEINSGADALRVDHQEVLDGQASGREDLASAMNLVHYDMQLLDDLLDASGDITVTAEATTLAEMLQATARVLAGRVAEQTGFAPIDMDAMVDLASRLRWAAEEAMRIEPGLDVGGAC